MGIVTYKVEASKAHSLRKQLLWSNVWSFILAIVGAVVGVGAALSGDSGAGVAAFILLAAFTGTTIWSVVVYWRSLWALWEWQGVAIGLGVAAVVIVLNLITGLVGTLASFAFFVYLYVQLGKQSGEVKIEKREVYTE